MRTLKYFVNTILIAVFSLSTMCYAYGQPTYSQFLEEEDINAKTEMALNFWNEYLRSDLDSLKIMAVEILMSAADENSEFARAAGYRALGSYQVRAGEKEAGLKHLNEANKYFELQSNYQLISETYNEIGNAYYMSGEYNDAIKAYIKSLETGKKSQDKTDVFNAKNGLSRAYCAIGDTAVGVYTMAEYKNESIKLGKMEAAADAYAYLGQIEMDRNNMTLSKEYYEKSILFSEKSLSKVHLAHSLNNKAILHFNLDELDSSLYYFEKSLRMREQLNHAKGVVESYYNIGFYYSATGDLHNSYINFSKSAEISKENSFKTDELDALTELANLCEEMGYDDELEKVNRRLEELNNFISEKSVTDKEIIEYAEKVIGDTEFEKKKHEFEEESYMYLWVLSITALILVVIVLRRRRKL